MADDYGLVERKKNEVTLPFATIRRLVLEQLPPGTKVSKETCVLISECCEHFIQLVSSEAVEHCQKDKKKLLGVAHLASALEQLGYASFLPAPTSPSEMQESSGSSSTSSSSKPAAQLKRARKPRRPKLTKEQEEALEKEQQMLIERAKASAARST